MGNGWIKLHRKIQECFLWSDKPYDKARAWIDLLLSAMHKDKKMMVDGKAVVIKQGSFMTSILKLSDKWGWSKKKTNAFIKMLENEKMVTTKGTPKGTTITIVNYEKYQVEGTTKDTTEDTTRDTTEDTTEDTQKKNIKNDKNDNKNTIRKSDYESLFEELWKLYPNKKGKGQVSDTAKKRLLKVGREEMLRAIERYKVELEKDDWRIPQNGSTFFNSGYVDYLDENYVPGKTSVKQKKNSFNNFPQRNYDFEELEKRLLE